MSYDEGYDVASLNYEQRQMLRDWELDNSPDLGSDWLEKVYAGEIDVPVGFAFDEHWVLVGHGRVTNSHCGSFSRPKVKHLVGCLRMKNHQKVGLDGVDYSNKVPVKRVFYSCDKPSCPACYLRGYAVRSAKRAERRLLWAYAKGQGKIEHIVVSPPQDESLSFAELRKIVLKAMLSRGIVGGCWVYHHFRYRNPAVARKQGLPVGWFRAPHFHVLGFIKGGFGACRSCSNCYLTAKGSHKVYDKEKCVSGCNGFMAVTHRAFDKDGCIAVVTGERKTIGGTLWYELSHASIKRDGSKHQIVNWFGTCGRNKLKIPKGSMPQKDNMCPICGEKMYKIRPTEHNVSMANLLAYMSGFKHSEVFMFDYADEDGNRLWECVHNERDSNG